MIRIENLQEMLESLPYWSLLGMKVGRMEEGYAEIHLPFKHDLAQVGGIMHGGAMASLLDAAGAVSLFRLVDLQKENMFTVELKINYLNPVTPEQEGITAVSRVLKKGRSIGVSFIEIRNAAGDPVAAGMTTYAIVPRK